MDSRSEARHSSLIETKTFCEIPANNTVLTGDPSFATDYLAYKSKLTTIEGYKQKSIAVLIGFTIDKANKEGILINDLLFISARIQVWASPTNNDNPAVGNAAKIPESQLPKLADTVLLSKANILKQIMIDNPSIVPAFVSTTRQADFATHIQDYEDVVELPETMIDTRATNTSLMKQAIKDTIKFRKDILLLDAKVVRETNVDIFLGFKQSMKIDNNPSIKFSFKGHLKDSVTGNDIANVHVLIADLPELRRSGEKGNFVFKSVPAGTYTVVFTKYGYQPKTVTVNINDGERTDLDIELIPVP